MRCAGDSLLDAELLGDDAAENIHFVAVGGGNNKIGGRNSRFLQYVVACTVAYDAFDVEVVDGIFNFLGVSVDDDYAMPFFGKLFDERHAD